MTGDSQSENAVIETALIFYRQHLMKELQKCDINFSDFGSLPYSRADVEKQNSFYHQLQNITAIIEARRRDHASEPPRSSMRPHFDRDGHGQLENDQGQQQTALSPTVLLRLNSVSSLPEAIFPSNGTSASREGGSQALNYQAKEPTADESNQSQGMAQSINLTPNTPGEVAKYEPLKQSSKIGNDVTTQGTRHASWQSIIPSNTIPESEKPAAQGGSPLSQNSGAAFSLYPPVPVFKKGSPASSVTSHEVRHISTPSASTDETLDHPVVKEAAYPKQPSSPPPAPPRSISDDTPKIRLRPKPSFHVSALSEFSNHNAHGAKPASSVPLEQQPQSTAPRRSLKDFEIPPLLPAISTQRKSSNNTLSDNAAIRPGETNAFPPLTTAKQNQERPGFTPARVSSDSESFSLPIFSNEAKTADKYLHNTEPMDKTGSESGPLPYQHKTPGSFSSRAMSDGRTSSQQSRLDNLSRNFSSQATFTPSKSSPIGSPFQSASAFSKKPDSPKSSLGQPGKPDVPQQVNALSPNQLGAIGPVPSDFGGRQDIETRKAAPEVPERLAPAAPRTFNGISPNQLKPQRLEMGQEIDEGQILPVSVPRTKFGAEPQSPQEGFISNKIRPNTLGEKNIVNGMTHSKDPSDKVHTGAPLADARSKIEEEQRFAQIVADLADQDEMAMLRKMQDDWNRDEDRREARQGLHATEKYRDHTEVNGNLAPVKFAASPDIGTAPSNIIVRPIRSTPAQNKRAPGSSGSNGSRNELEKQTRQASSRAAKPTEPSSTASNSNNLPTHKDPECTVCGDTLSGPSEIAMLPCNHTYHPSCLASGFQHALAGGKLFICCKALPAPIDIVSSHLPPQFVAKYKAKIIERSTPNPIYCAKPGCAAFIPPENITGPLAKCAICNFVTCKMCRNPEHKGVCPPDKDGGMLMQLAGSNSWCQCQRCKSMVERDEGCLHMTCTCGHEFCYNCGGVWDTCGGSCPRRS